MKFAGKSGPSQRQLRVGEQVRSILSEALQNCALHDPDLENAHTITVTEVRMSPDLKQAKVFVIPLGGREIGGHDTEGEILPALNRAKSYFRKHLGNALELRYTPDLRFVSDTSFDKAEHIEELLRKDRERRQ